MNYDVLIVGAGPAGLSAAIKLKQLSTKVSVCVIEKGAEIGAHILSGAILETRALDELLPNWRELNFPIHQNVTNDNFLYLTQHKSIKLPIPPIMQNHDNFIISLSDVCKRLGEIAEDLGVEIYPGFAGSEVLYDDADRVIGVATGDMGIDKNGEHTPNYQMGMALYAHQTLFAEGCRGSLSKTLIQKFNLQKDACPQTYGIGFKEIWQVKQNSPGTVAHTIGWPLDHNTYGGSFIYHMAGNKVSVGFVIGLDYQNPWLNPFEEFQRFKTHPCIKTLLEGGERIAYGAKALSEGGLQSIPKLTFPGGLLIGDSAGFLNVAKIKGTHTAMKSGMLAAESLLETLQNEETTPQEVISFEKAIHNSWIHEELYRVRNVRPAFNKGLLPALLYNALDQYILKGNAPWTFKHKADHLALKPAANTIKIKYPKPDNKLTFDKPSSVFLAGTFHEENQPAHLKLKQPDIAIEINLATYASPETRYCPAGVYEIIEVEGKKKLQINAPNCIHCKTCDIKDPSQNIDWIPPEGGGGPNFTGM